jgi:hypothetical protein
MQPRLDAVQVMLDASRDGLDFLYQVLRARQPGAGLAPPEAGAASATVAQAAAQASRLTAALGPWEGGDAEQQDLAVDTQMHVARMQEALAAFAASLPRLAEIGGALGPLGHSENAAIAHPLARLLGLSFPRLPLLMLVAERDDYDSDGGASCRRLAASGAAAAQARMQVHVLAGATHMWDSESNLTFRDPAARRGQGGQIRVLPNRAAKGSKLASLLAEYRLIETFTEYLLIEPERIEAELHRKSPEGGWTCATLTGAEDSIELESNLMTMMMTTPV